MEINLLFDNKTDNKTFTADFFSKISNMFFKTVTFDKDFVEISILVVDNPGIREINRLYRNMDEPTDVLSFPMNEDGGIDSPILGDVVISADKAVSQAEYAEIPLEREIAFLYIHGLLHLLGYDHEKSEDEEKVMFDLQEQILKQVIEAGICP